MRKQTGAPAENGRPGSTGSMLTPDRVVIFEDPVSRQEIFERLTRAARSDDPIHWKPIVAKLMEREKTGSTFLNEGVALPPARIDGLSTPQVALAITREGVLDPNDAGCRAQHQRGNRQNIEEPMSHSPHCIQEPSRSAVKTNGDANLTRTFILTNVYF